MFLVYFGKYFKATEESSVLFNGFMTSLVENGTTLIGCLRESSSGAKILWMFQKEGTSEKTKLKTRAEKNRAVFHCKSLTQGNSFLISLSSLNVVIAKEHTHTHKLSKPKDLLKINF